VRLDVPERDFRICVRVWYLHQFAGRWPRPWTGAGYSTFGIYPSFGLVELPGAELVVTWYGHTCRTVAPARVLPRFPHGPVVASQLHEGRGPMLPRATLIALTVEEPFEGIHGDASQASIERFIARVLRAVRRL
jgi:hypothetical protein